MLPYATSRTRTIRRATREVAVGNVLVGGKNPIRVQSMTTTPTEDVAATVAQSRELIEAGCEIVRITAPSMKAARALKEIREQLSKDQMHTPLVADIHFMPKAAMEAVEHVEKVRINPGNFADYKKFKILEYTDKAYAEELERLYEAFTPFILRCKELGRSIRIGTNHGSLSDRIMNRYGDTPQGMVESALEFIRIAESHGFRDIILSMKASNPKVMVAAYRLAVARMYEEQMDYPLHLGVTEAGDGEDARVKSCIGIGTLLADGLGDTLRVSLTEDPVHEVPVGKELANWAAGMWTRQGPIESVEGALDESIDFYSPEKRKIDPVSSGGKSIFQTDIPPLVAVGLPDQSNSAELVKRIAEVQVKQSDAPIEYWIHRINNQEDIDSLQTLTECLPNVIKGFILDFANYGHVQDIFEGLEEAGGAFHWIINLPIEKLAQADLSRLKIADHFTVCFDFSGVEDIGSAIDTFLENWEHPFLITTSKAKLEMHPIGVLRTTVSEFHKRGKSPAVWLRNLDSNFSKPAYGFAEILQESSIYSGSCLCEGIGNLISVEVEPNLLKSTALAYNILQGARARISKTEFVACPSCGRTLFDLQSTTQKIRSRTSHLKGVTIAIMGCIVNGPGEMADADFGYVGGAPGKVNLYVGKTCVKNGIPEAEAVDRLIDLIRENGKWVDPKTAPTQ
ncbi:MAG: (E)-4-hydroxy-3-methylbut-2-enyl-diphosphate synthase [Opitutales bacterium]|nr:(E)-4-hydroxy-3-methylbut-2-enyl-diphosphate synthase [Opitutales bacterium]